MMVSIKRKFARFAIAALGAASIFSAGSALAAHSFALKMDQTHFDFNSIGDHSVSGMITNTTDKPLTIQFQRTQFLPKGWSSSICFGTACYAPTTDTAAAVWDPQSGLELVLHFIIGADAGTDSLAVHLLLLAQDGDPTDTTFLTVYGVYKPSGIISFSLDQMETGVKLATTPGETKFTGQLANITSGAAAKKIRMSWKRNNYLPTGWSSYVSVGTTNYPANHDTDSYVFDKGDVEDLTVHILSVAGSPSDSGAVALRLKVEHGAIGDTVWLRMAAVVRPAGVSDGQTYSAAPTLQSLYPSPAKPGVATSLDIYSPKTTTCNILLCDMLGRTIAQLGNHSLVAGMNHLSLQTPMIAEGGYFLRVEYDGYSSEVRRLSIER